MRSGLVLLALLAALPAFSPPLSAQTSDERDVLAVVQRLFDAMRSRDTSAMRAVLDSGARLVTTAVRNGQPVMRGGTIDGFIASVGRAQQALDERTYSPEVRVDDNLATVWTGYTFFFGGRFSHCGVDSFQLARTASGWRIIAIADTQRADRCPGPTSP
jgi:hypothetical protein